LPDRGAAWRGRPAGAAGRRRGDRQGRPGRRAAGDPRHGPRPAAGALRHRRRRHLRGRRARQDAGLTGDHGQQARRERGVVMARLQGRSTIVTGAASGIGRASAILFAKEGASVVCVDRAETVADTVKEIEAAGGRAVAMTGDVSDEAFVESFVARAVSDFGGLDACFANAGISNAGQAAFDELNVDYWLTILKVNLIGPFLAIKHAARVMIPNGKGSIICTA